MTDEEFAELYPMHAKWDPVRDEAQAIGQFIENGGYVLCDWPEGQEFPQQTRLSINEILAIYYEIDLKALEDEKQRMLEQLANRQG